MDFHRFLETQAKPAGAFLITVELDEGGLVWFHYIIEISPEGGAVVGSKVTMQFPKDENPDNRACPSEWKGLPVWRYLDK